MIQDIANIRALFNTAHLEKNDCEKLLKLTEGREEAIVRAYNAAAIMVSGKYLINPFKITKAFNDGKALLEDVISENFDEEEIRYLRYTIQLNVPKFIGYYKNIEMDRKLLIDYIKTNRNSDLTKHMMVFLEDTKDVILQSI